MLLVFLFTTDFICSISSVFIVCSNDGSHFALVRASVEQGSVKISDFVNYTMMRDCAYKNGEYYMHTMGKLSIKDSHI